MAYKLSYTPATPFSEIAPELDRAAANDSLYARMSEAIAKQQGIVGMGTSGFTPLQWQKLLNQMSGYLLEKRAAYEANRVQQKMRESYGLQ